MIKVDQIVIVEGKYDKIKLSSIIDGIIIETEGFGIFKDKEKQKLIRKLAEKKGVVILTDSDSAGFVIRNFITSIVPNENITLRPRQERLGYRGTRRGTSDTAHT